MRSEVVWANELHVAPATTSPSQAREFVQRYCLDQGLPHLVDDVCLVASELVTNAVVHAQTRIRVRIEVLTTDLKLTVYDEAADLPVQSLAGRVLESDESGRGLWLVDACSSDWGTEVGSDEGKSTWALFALRAETADGPSAAD